MDMTCRCKGNYTCVACKVKRGDYRDWIEAEKKNACVGCGTPVGPRATQCLSCYWDSYYGRVTA